MKSSTFLTVCIVLFSFCISCSSDDSANATDDDASASSTNLIIKLNVDPTQPRLGNTGQPTPLPAGHAGQDPSFNRISAHYLELSPSANTLLGQGEILYNAPETQAGGSSAIDFEQATVVQPGAVFLTIPINEIAAGNYEWVRLSLSYQNYDIDFSFNGTPLTGTVASFVGFETYLQSYTIKNESVTVNENRRQGYWGFETNGIVQTGLAPEGATTVPNPLFDSSPIPAGSCVVTGKFASNLVITGNETEDITVTLSLSTNKSFEWIDTNGNNNWDVTTSGAESIVDMGLRGLVPSHNN